MRKWVLAAFLTVFVLVPMAGMAQSIYDYALGTPSSPLPAQATTEPEMYQEFGLTPKEYEYFTCVAYFARNDVRFSRPPTFTTTLNNDHTGWTTSMSPDGKACFLFGPRSHFGPDLSLRYGISYKIWYHAAIPVLQDTVVWDGMDALRAWSRYGIPGNESMGGWNSAVPLDEVVYGPFNSPSYVYSKALECPVNTAADQAQWSPDGSKVVWSERTWDPYTGLDISRAVKYGDWDSAAKTITNIRIVDSYMDPWGQPVYAGDPRWSPDGTYIAYIKWDPSWLPAGEASSQVWRYSLIDSTHVCLYAPPSGEDVQSFDFLGRGTLISWDAYDSSADFFTYGLKTGLRTRLTTTPDINESEPRIWHSDSNQILYRCRESSWRPYGGIEILNTGDGSVSEIAAGTAEHAFYQPAWGCNRSWVGLMDWMGGSSSDISLYSKTAGVWGFADDVTGGAYTGGAPVFLGDVNAENSVLFHATCDWTGQDIWYAERQNSLMLTVPESDLYVRPGNPVHVALGQTNVGAPATGYEAFLSFDDPKLTIGSADVAFTPAPYGLPIYKQIAGGTIDLAAGINNMTGQTPSRTRATLASLTFRVPAETTDSAAQVVFRASDPVTTMSDDLGMPIPLTTMDSPEILIDGTAPANVSVSSDPSAWTNAKSATLTFSAEDPVSGGVSSGIDRYELSVDGGTPFAVVSPYVLDISDFGTGPHSFSVTAYDRAGNSASASTTLDIDRTDPVITIDSATQGGSDLLVSGTAIQGDVETLVSVSDPDSGLAGPPTVTVTAGSETTVLTATAVDSDTWSYTYTVTAATANGTATIDATVSDNVGRSSSAQSTFEINKTTATVTVELSGVGTATQRMITFVIGGTGEAGTTESPLTYTVPVNFDSSGIGSYTFANLPYNGSWTKISAKDDQHTLRQLVDLSVDSYLQYTASFTGTDALVGGDATNDNLIDIRDFSLFAAQYGTAGHPFADRDADFSCDGTVYTEDFTFITNSFLSTGESAAGAAMALSMSAAEPISSISVKELAKIIGHRDAKRADLNKDGVVDTTDVQLFAQGVRRHKQSF